MTSFTLCERLGRLADLTASDEKHLDGIEHIERTVPARTEILDAHTEMQYLPLVVDGWTVQYQLAPDGRRTVHCIAIPGDVVDNPLGRAAMATCSSQALTEATLRFYPIAPLRGLIRREARIAAAFFAWEASYFAMLRGRLLPLTQFTAYERLVHFCLDLLARLEEVGLAENDTFPLPISQALIGDYLGMHEVHVNRTFRRIERDGYIERTKGHVRVCDRDALSAMIGFHMLVPAPIVD